MIEIPLSQEQIAFVDDCDADLAILRWHALFSPKYSGGGKFKACRNLPTVKGKHTTEYMHRVILSRMLGRPLLRSELCDHKDLNPLNNRRENLRLATNAQNTQNTNRRSDNTSGYKGVTWRKDGRKWRAAIMANNKRISLGSFSTPEEAYAAYCEAALKFHGEFAQIE